MTTRLPLPTLLSRALVAFTIEFNNESEHRMPHRTSDSPQHSGVHDAPWLVSKVMWSNVMQYLPTDGLRVGDLHVVANTKRDSLVGLQRWGYVVVNADPAYPSGARARGRADDSVVRPTAAGRRAQEIWQPIAGEIERRWRARFGDGDVDRLRRSLLEIVAELEVCLPDYLPVVYPTMNGRTEVQTTKKPAIGEALYARADTGKDLSVLLSNVLLAFTIDFEAESKISLPISANALRVIDQEGVRVRDLPRLSGVSKEANAMSVGFLQRHGCAVVVPDPTATRGKMVRLTPKGHKALDKYLRVLGLTEQSWKSRFGEARIADLRAAAERIVGGDPIPEASPLMQGLVPYPDGWRASVKKPNPLPHYPMVLHRGGYPDGS